MNGIDPYAYMQQVATKLDRTNDPAEIHRMLDELEYLFEVIDPELQSLAETLMDRLRERLAEIRSVDS
jgi:hypothetical protein